MSGVIEKEDWDALIEVIDKAILRLDDRKIQPVKDSLLEFTTTAAMLGLEDVANAATKILDFLVKEVGASWDAEAAATISFTMAGFREKMAAEPYSPSFSDSIAEILLFMDFFEKEEPASPTGSVPEEAPAAPVEGGPQASSPEPPPLEPADLVEFEAPTIEPAEPLSVLPQTDDEIEPLPGVSKPEPQDAVAQDLIDVLLQEESVHGSLADERRIPVHPIEKEADRASEAQGDAVALYRKMLEMDPTSSVFVHLAEELSSRGFWNETAVICRQGLTHHPSNLRGRVLLGLALRETGESHEAFMALTEARHEIERNIFLYRVLAEIAEEENDPARSEHLMRVHEVLQQEGAALADSAERRRVEPAPQMQPHLAHKGELPVEEQLIDALSNFIVRMEKKPPVGVPTRRVLSETSRDKLKKILSCRTIH